MTFSPLGEATNKVVLVGSSTGGTDALRVILEQLPSTVNDFKQAQHILHQETNI